MENVSTTFQTSIIYVLSVCRPAQCKNYLTFVKKYGSDLGLWRVDDQWDGIQFWGYNRLFKSIIGIRCYYFPNCADYIAMNGQEDITHFSVLQQSKLKGTNI